MHNGQKQGGPKGHEGAREESSGLRRRDALSETSMRSIGKRLGGQEEGGGDMN